MASAMVGSNALYMSFDLGDRNWQVSVSEGRNGVSRYTVAAGDAAAVADCIVKAAKQFKIGGRALAHGVYEAGRDGW
jgi:transposase